jgi:predicted enzyme related to lactoylglutathione lyase
MAIGGRARLPVLPQPGANTFASGQAMMAVVTDDIAAVIARAKGFGAPILVGPIEAETPRGREREIVILDPDNTRIHVVQMFPASPEPQR